MHGDNYSLMRGGPTHRLLDRLGLIGRHNGSAAWLATLLVVICLAPIAMACALDGTLWRQPPGGPIPLLGDYAVLARFLVALPLLVLLAPRSDRILKVTIRQWLHSGLVPPSRERALTTALQQMRRMRDALSPELVCLLLATVALALPGPSLVDRLPGLAEWSVGPDGELTQAGFWLRHVATPLFRFVMLAWLWRLLMWAQLLWHLSRLRLDLHPAHPDGAGGLGFLGLAQERFAVISVANGFVLCGVFANHMLYLGETLFTLRYLMVGYVLGASVLVVAPLAVMSPTMVRAKRHGLLKFDALANRMTRAFDRRWKRGADPDLGDDLIDVNDASALADFTSDYNTVRGMSSLPISRWSLARIALAAAVPLTPLALLAFSVDEIAAKLFSLLA